jgi:hypothetical protein
MEALLGISGFVALLVIGYLVLIIAAIVKFFQMASDVREIKHLLEQRNVSVRMSKQSSSDDFWNSADDGTTNSQKTQSTAVVNEAVASEQQHHYYSPVGAKPGETVFKMSDGRTIEIRTVVSNVPSVGDSIVTPEKSSYNGAMIVTLGLKSWELDVKGGVITSVLTKQEIELSSGLKVFYYSHNNAPVGEGDHVYLSNGQPVPDGEYRLAERYGGEKLEIKNQIVVKEGKESNRAALYVIGIIVLVLIIAFSLDL